MAPPVYSLRIFGHAGLTHLASPVGPVVPSGFIYVLRDIDVYELSGTSSTTLIVLNANGGFLWSASRPITDGISGWAWRGRQVYAEGEQVGFQALSGTWAIAASGYQLTLP